MSSFPITNKVTMFLLKIHSYFHSRHQNWPSIAQKKGSCFLPEFFFFNLQVEVVQRCWLRRETGPLSCSEKADDKFAQSSGCTVQIFIRLHLHAHPHRVTTPRLVFLVERPQLYSCTTKPQIIPQPMSETCLLLFKNISKSPLFTSIRFRKLLFIPKGTTRKEEKA